MDDYDMFYYSNNSYKYEYDDTKYDYIMMLISEFRKDPYGVDISVIDRIKDYYEDVVIYKLNTKRENLLIGVIQKHTNYLYFKDKNRDNPIIVLDLKHNMYYNRYYNKNTNHVLVNINETSREKLNNNDNDNNNDSNNDSNNDNNNDSNNDSNNDNNKNNDINKINNIINRCFICLIQ